MPDNVLQIKTAANDEWLAGYHYGRYAAQRLRIGSRWDGGAAGVADRLAGSDPEARDSLLWRGAAQGYLDHLPCGAIHHGVTCDPNGTVIMIGGEQPW